MIFKMAVPPLNGKGVFPFPRQRSCFTRRAESENNQADAFRLGPRVGVIALFQGSQPESFYLQRSIISARSASVSARPFCRASEPNAASTSFDSGSFLPLTLGPRQRKLSEFELSSFVQSFVLGGCMVGTESSLICSSISFLQSRFTVRRSPASGEYCQRRP